MNNTMAELRQRTFVISARLKGHLHDRPGDPCNSESQILAEEAKAIHVSGACILAWLHEFGWQRRRELIHAWTLAPFHKAPCDLD
jgi:hypothetical protein